MLTPIPQERFTEELYQILEETFENVHGIYLDRGTSLGETLEELTAGEASRPISAHCASVAAHVAHVIFYLEVLERVMQNEEVGKIDWEESWLVTEVSPDEWAAQKAQLRQTYQRILARMRGFPSWDGKNAVSGALAILAHTAYHVGAIRLALCVITGNE